MMQDMSRVQSTSEDPVTALTEQFGRLAILSSAQVESDKFPTLDIPHVRTLCVTAARTTTSEHFHRFFSRCAAHTELSLESLTVADFVVRDAELIEAIKLYIPRIQILCLRGPIGFPGCIQLLALEQLRVLKLKSEETAVKVAHDPPFIDDCLRMLSEGLKNLERIKLQGFSEITAKGCMPLAHCKLVRRISLKDCPKITQETLSCNDVLLLAKFKVTSSPYRIVVREATKYDRQNIRETLNRQMGDFGTILVDAPTCNPEALSIFRSQIAEKEALIKRLVENIAFLEQKVANKNGELLTKKRKEHAQLVLELQDLKAEYEQGNRIREGVKTRAVQVVEEADKLVSKSMVVSILSKSHKLLFSLVEKLEGTGKANEPCVAKIIEYIRINERKTGPIELTFLFTAEEIDLLKAIGFFNDK